MIQILKYSSAILSLLCTSSIFAEYRVYQYIVRSNTQEITPKSYFITSTLDPISYLSYHGGSGSLKIDLSRTWTCLGNTGGRDICPDPSLKASAPQQGNPL